MADYILHGFLRIATDFVPETFGHLTTIGPKFMLPIGSKGEHKSHQVCECICGNVKTVTCGQLKTGRTTSCGCLQREITIKANTTHGLTHNNAYGTWLGMMLRCYREDRDSYPNYGGRGIKVCDR